MKISLILCFIIGSLQLSSCKKEVEELPPATQTGAHTFGAKVNGDLWIPAGFGPIPANNLLQARWAAGGSSLYINARNFASSPNEKEFEIYIKDLTAPGTYLLNTTLSGVSQSASYAYYVKRNVSP